MIGELNINTPKTIGLVSDFFNPEILEGAHAYTKEHGLFLDARWSVRGDWTPQKPGWDGVIYSIVDDSKLMKRIQKWKIPKVSLILDIVEDWSVDPDYEQCGVLAANEAIQAGATTLLNVAVSNRKIDVRFAQGVTMAATKHGVPCHQIDYGSQRISQLIEFLIPEIQSHSSSYPLCFCNPHAGVTYSLQKELE